MTTKMDGPGLAALAGGIVFVYAGIQGYSPLKAFENIVHGRNPNEGQSTTNLVSAATAAASGGGTATGTGPTTGGGTASSNQALAKQIAIAMGHADWTTGQQWADWVSLWDRESQWSATALNPSSGAFGIPQALPADKMASAGADWKTNPATQIRWGIGYIAGRYGSPSVAWAHEQANNWY
jgi:hypothetical protein